MLPFVFPLQFIQPFPSGSEIPKQSKEVGKVNIGRIVCTFKVIKTPTDLRGRGRGEVTHSLSCPLPLTPPYVNLHSIIGSPDTVALRVRGPPLSFPFPTMTTIDVLSVTMEAL